MVARTTAQQVSTETEAATALHQYAPFTRRGCECVAYFMQALTDLSPEATVVSIDADLFSRNTMLEGLLQTENGDQPIRAQFPRARFNICVWRTRWAPYTTEGGAGERLDAFVSQLGQRQVLVAVQARLHDCPLCTFGYEWWDTVASTAATVCCSCRNHERRRCCLRCHAAPRSAIGCPLDSAMTRLHFCTKGNAHLSEP